jgi:hypothetical protein
VTAPSTAGLAVFGWDDLNPHYAQAKNEDDMKDYEEN